MSTRALATVVAVVLVVALTLGAGALSLRRARTPSEYYVASRAVSPATNAAAVSGEYLSAASFLGIAGLVLSRGATSLWYPVGWTAGYLLLLLFVAAPLRRSRAYTLPDFAELRLGTTAARGAASTMVVVVALLYLVPQFREAGLTLRILTGAPTWVGAAVVAAVVLVNVTVGGMRSITLAQALQYWLKLAALCLPLAFLLVHRTGGGGVVLDRLRDPHWLEPVHGGQGLYVTYSLVVALFLGTMGLPHVAVRFYTNRDGRAARRTTVVVLALLSVFYVLPPVYGALARAYLPETPTPGTGAADAAILTLPGHVVGATLGDVLVAVLAAGAFAAFLSTSSGLVLSIAGVVGQDVIGRRLPAVPAFQVAGVLVAAGALALTLLTSGLAVAQAVELAFAVAASTLCPLLLLGIWWRGLTSPGAVAGMVVGGVLSTAAVLTVTTGAVPRGGLGVVVAQPALLTVPAAFATMVVVSRLTRGAPPAHVARIMVRLHTPEAVALDREGFRARGADD